MVVGVLFDVDGTLVTFKFDVGGTRKALIEEMGRRGFSTDTLDLSSSTQKIMDTARAQAAAGQGSSFEEFRKAVFAILDSFEVKSVGTTSILPGVKETLDTLRARGARLAVLTNSGRMAADDSLRRAGLADRFEFVMTRDDTEIMKPRPEGVTMAAAKLGLAKSSVYYVWDSLLDVQATRAAGVRMVGVATGNYSMERLRAEGADWAIPDITRLGAILGF
jgi:phosphoglycolate phosphatase